MRAILILFLVLFSNSIFAQSLNGAWEKVTNSESQQRTIKLYSDSYFTSSTILKDSGEFISASGGTYFMNDYDYIENLEIHSESAAITGSFFNYNYEIKGDSLNIKDKNSNTIEKWTRIDNADNENVTCWKIHQAFRDSNWITIEDGPRKTLKLLTNNYYQVLALNSRTGQFFGSSGGQWELKDNKHYEFIHFFSKNQKMVGDTLSFEKVVKENIWTHNGKSSKGDYIQERWKRFK
ncbi:hypothetical protein ES731_11270 [Psychroflexus gondwanensis]|uniref:hypothetical protein n=1 Tax=Psychroflexus gondwanensis TaxID=251 RepID=UPI0011BE7100|nr:hypothetical protein [Psychroflexus gondwanensis]TXE17957.1 hypothetical protein ES731_11270 [Psychroflexus gondwanensis]